MDKLFNSHWFVKIISFFIALMLFAMVNMDNLNNQPGVLPTKQVPYSIGEVALDIIYDSETYEVVDQPESVQVNLKGPQTSITRFQLSRGSYEVFADLTGREEGVHTVDVKYRGFPSDLSVTIVPQYVQVELQEKQTVSLPVQVELLNSDDVKKGYSVGTPIVSPVNIEVTAARDYVSQVKVAKATIDVSGADETIEEAAPVKLYDANGDELSLTPEPSVVDIRVPVTSPNRVVPTRVNRVGELQDGISIEELTIEPAEVTIYGPMNVIEDINVIDVGELDLSKITESQTLEMTIPLPPDVESVSPEEVTVTVTITIEETKEFPDIPIGIIGASDQTEITLEENPNRLLTITARGSGELLDKLTASDIQAYIDVSDLSPGEHSAEVQVNGPPNIRFELENTTIPITIQSSSESMLSEGEND